MFKKHYESLEDYLTCFKYTTMVMQSAENVERVSYEFADDNYQEGVRYFEVCGADVLQVAAQRLYTAGCAVLTALACFKLYVVVFFQASLAPHM